MLKKRIITAAIFVLLIILATIFLSPIVFNLMALLIVSIAAWEFSGFFKDWDYQKRLIFLVVILLSSIPLQLAPFIPVLTVSSIFWLLVPGILWKFALEDKSYFNNFKLQMLLGFLIFIPCWFGLLVIRGKFGNEFLFYLLALVAATDTGAYFAGKFFGKNLMFPKVSPKKTVEGLIGGVLSAVLVAIIGFVFFKLEILGANHDYLGLNFFSGISFVMLSIITCLWSVIGDLFESMLKRQAGVKDSGKILPGHGGMYDRIDSLTAAIPIFALGLLLI